MKEKPIIPELWTYIEDFPKYRISDHGKVVGPEEKVLTQCLNKQGYYVVSLSIGKGKCKVRGVHRLVAEAFVPRYDDRLNTVRHQDTNKTNNHADNLIWTTRNSYI